MAFLPERLKEGVKCDLEGYLEHVVGIKRVYGGWFEELCGWWCLACVDWLVLRVAEGESEVKFIW